MNCFLLYPGIGPLLNYYYIHHHHHQMLFCRLLVGDVRLCCSDLFLSSFIYFSPLKSSIKVNLFLPHFLTTSDVLLSSIVSIPIHHIICNIHSPFFFTILRARVCLCVYTHRTVNSRAKIFSNLINYCLMSIFFS